MSGLREKDEMTRLEEAHALLLSASYDAEEGHFASAADLAKHALELLEEEAFEREMEKAP